LARRTEASASFFEKKEAKKLHPINFCFAILPIEGTSNPNMESFLLLFFKKEALAFLGSGFFRIKNLALTVCLIA